MHSPIWNCWNLKYFPCNIFIFCPFFSYADAISHFNFPHLRPAIICPKKDPQNIIIPTYEHCKEKWDYTFVKDTITGSVIYFEKAPFACGNISTASITIIKTKKGDSLRIIQVCDTTIFISLKQMLSIIPDYTNYSNIALPFNTSKTDCEVKKTIYGKVWKPWFL